MAYNAQKTEHAGPKKGNGAYWGYKKDAKKESNRKRRDDGKKIIRHDPDVEEIFFDDPDFIKVIQDLASAIHRKYHNKKIPSIEEQLKDLFNE